MDEEIFTFKTESGETLLSGIHDADSKTGITYLSYPIKILFNTAPTPIGILTHHIPVLYQPFGDSRVVAMRNSHFVSIAPASLADERYYFHYLSTLIKQETQRLLVMDALYNEAEYPDTYIMKAPETIQ